MSPSFGGALKCTAVFFMELPPKDVLSSGSESTAFLLLAWQEMFDPYVPDTFQPRLFNIPLLVAELGSIAEKAMASDRWQPHVKAIQDELACAVEGDSAFLAQLPYFRWASAAVSKKTSIYQGDKQNEHIVARSRLRPTANC